MKAIAGFAEPNAFSFDYQQILQALPAAIYTTDAAGRVTFYNEAALRLWGIKPVLGQSKFCGSWRLSRPDGRPLPFDECPMALALKERRAIEGMEAVAERPDGTRVPFLAFPTPLFDTSGALLGGLNMLIDITGRKAAEQATYRLAAIVESSDDAILAKDLNGIITAWNEGAERLFGYKAEEALGKSVTMLIPLDRHDEEPAILAQIRSGNRVEHYETLRRRKDGSLVEISLTVSPVRDQEGRIVGASKIARDITERRQAEERRRLLLREMNHRVKNLFALAGSVVSLSARWAKTPAEVAAVAQSRLAALARAHALTLPSASEISEIADGAVRATTLRSLIQTIMSPFENCEAGKPRTVVSGCNVPVLGTAVTSLAMLLHEFATNAAKYGAFSVPEGTVHIDCRKEEGQLTVIWQERDGPTAAAKEIIDGFGSMLARATIESQFGGRISREWTPGGLLINFTFPSDCLTAPSHPRKQEA